MIKHRHKFRTASWTANKAQMRCNCGEQMERPATRTEKKWYKVADTELLDVHLVWRSFAKKFIRVKDGKRVWELRGYPFIQAVEKWAKKFPQSVRIVGCDDYFFTSSVLVLIEHRAVGNWKTAQYMGTSLVIIPQNGEPLQVFLYPCDTIPLIKALQDIRKAAAPIERAERKRDGHERRLRKQFDVKFLKSRRST